MKLTRFASQIVITQTIVCIYDYAIVWFRYNCFLYYKNCWIQDDIIFKTRWGICIFISRPMRTGHSQWKAGHPWASLMNWRTLNPLSGEACSCIARILSQNYSSPCLEEADPEFLKDPKATKISLMPAPVINMVSPAPSVESCTFLRKVLDSLFIYCSSESQEKVTI